MKFLLDEDVPVKLLTTLRTAGHDVTRVTASTPDPAVAVQARHEGRVLITLDKDFANSALYPPERCAIVLIRIHPPYAGEIIHAFLALLARVPPERLTGLTVLGAAGSLHLFE